MTKFADHMEKIAEGVTAGYRKIEDGVVGAYRKAENAFVRAFMAKEGESVGDAKARAAARQAMIGASLEKARNAGKIDR